MASPLESYTTRTLLGIRFWDPAMDRQISDGLQVTASPEAVTDIKVQAFRTASGNFAFQNLLGMRAYEYPTVNTDPMLDSPLTPSPFIIEVFDTRGDFMPIRFLIELPLAENGLYQPTVLGSPPSEESARFYLFSAPSRSGASGLAVVRVTLTLPDDLTPAAYALLEIEEYGRRWYGLADSRGCAAVLFPYPTFITALGTSPPGLPPSQQVWPLTIRVRHDPGLMTTLENDQMPTLRQIRNQPEVGIWQNEAGPATTILLGDLTYGRELILRTENQSNLWIGAATP